MLPLKRVATCNLGICLVLFIIIVTVGFFPFGEIFQDTQATVSDEVTITTPIILLERNETTLHVSCHEPPGFIYRSWSDFIKLFVGF